MRSKGHLSHFERDVVAGARQTGLSVSESADLVGFPPTQPSPGCTEEALEKEISREQLLSAENRKPGQQKVGAALPGRMNLDLDPSIHL